MSYKKKREDEKNRLKREKDNKSLMNQQKLEEFDFEDYLSKVENEYVAQ